MPNATEAWRQLRRTRPLSGEWPLLQPLLGTLPVITAEGEKTENPTEALKTGGRSPRFAHVSWAKAGVRVPASHPSGGGKLVDIRER